MAIFYTKKALALIAITFALAFVSMFSVPARAHAACNVTAGCTGQTAFSIGGFLFQGNDPLRLSASSSPTVGWIFATTTTATSTLQKTSVSALSIGSLSGLLKAVNGYVIQAVANTDYQSPITLTTTGSSGASTFDGTTLNIPQYSGGAGSAFAWTPSTNYGALANATNTPIWLKQGVQASSTSLFANAGNEVRITSTGIVGISTTTPGQSSMLGVTGNVFVSGTVYAANFFDTALSGTNCVSETNGLLGTANCVSSITSANGTLTVSSPTGGVTLTYTGLATTSNAVQGNLFYSSGGSGVANVATSAPTVTAPITYSGTLGAFVGGVGGTFGCTNASAGVTGCLTGTDWSTFNNKTSWPYTINAASVFYGQVSNSTTTEMHYGAAGYSLTASTTAAFNIINTGSSTPTAFANAPLVVAGNNANYTQAVIQNLSNGVNASGLLAVHADIGTDSTYYHEFGINNSGYSQATFSSQNRLDAFNVASDGALVIGTASTTNTLADLRFITGGTASSSIRMVIRQSGLIGIATTTPIARLGIGSGDFSATASSTALLAINVTGSSTPAFYVSSPNTNSLIGIGTTSPLSRFVISSGDFSAIASSTSLFSVNIVGSSTPAFYIGSANQGGRIGIGTTSPWSSLSIDAPAGVSPFSIGSTTGNTLAWVDILGKFNIFDVIHRWSGVVSSTRALSMQVGTTTTWTATTSGAYIAQAVAPFPGTIRQIRCSLDASFLGVNIQIGGSNIAPSYFVASTTVGAVTPSGSNTFTEGQVITASFGTTTTATTQRGSCTLYVTETP